MLSKSAKRIEFRCFHKKKKVCEEMDMLISLTVVIISLCIGTSNHHVRLKHIWFLFLKERQMNKKKKEVWIFSWTYRETGLPLWLRVTTESACQRKRTGRCKFDPWVRKIPWRRKWQPTPVFLLGKSHGQRSLAGYGVVHGATKCQTGLNDWACTKGKLSEKF